MELTLQTLNHEPGGVIQVADAVFSRPFNATLVHQVVTSYLTMGRSGNRAQKNRAQVRGGGCKPWRQKGTGRARAGTIRSPLWRGGGVTFAAAPKTYQQKLNKKMYRRALGAILSELLRQKRLIVVESFQLEAPKTKLLVQQLKALQVSEVLIVTETEDEQLSLAARNLHPVAVQVAATVDPVSLIAFNQVLMTVAALKKIEQRVQLA